MAKKKKKLDVKFLTLLGVVAVCIAILVGGAGYVMFGRESPETFRKAGREAMDRGDWQEAWDNLSQMFRKQRDDLEALFWYYEASMRLASFPHPTNDYYRIALRNLGAILAADPSYLPALKAQLDDLRLRVEISSASAETLSLFKNCIDIAERIRKVEPGNVEAAEMLAIARVQTALAAGSQVDSFSLAKTIEEVSQLNEEVPNDPEILYQLATARFARAQALRREYATTTDPPDVVEAFAAARAAKQQLEALGGPGSTLPPAEQGHALVRAITVNFSELASITDENARKEGLKHILDLATRAIEVDSPDGKWFVFHMNYVGRVAELLGNPGMAERAFRRAIEGAPEHWMPRLELADLLSKMPGKMPDAIALLEKDLEPSYKLYGLVGKIFQSQSIDAATMRAYYRLRHLPTLPQDERPPLAKLIRQDLDRVTAIAGESNPRVLLVKGGLMAYDGDRTGALAQLNRAMELTSDTNPAQRDLRTQLRVQIAEINLQLNQTGQARQVLSELVAASNNPQARLMLARILIRDREFAPAREQLEKVVEIEPDNNEARTLLVQLMQDPQNIAAEFAKLPENTIQERILKMQVALRTRRVDDALRLGESVLAESPDERTNVILLANVYNQLGRKDDALRVVDAGLKATPDDATLKSIKGQLTATTVEERNEVIDEQIESITDPYERAMAEAGLAMQRGDTETYLAKLASADSIDPNRTGRAAEMLFLYHAGRGEFDKAEPWLKRLSELNVDQAQGRIYRARVMLAQNRVADAMNEARTLTQQMPDFAQPWVLLGQCYQYNNNFEDAMSAYNQALSRQPTNSQALRGIIESLKALNRGSETRQYLERGLRIDPYDAYFREEALTWAQNYGNADSAVAAREKLLEVGQDRFENWYKLALAYETAGRRKLQSGDTAGGQEMFKKAFDTYRQAIARFPDQLAFVDRYANMSRVVGEPDAGLRALESASANPKFAGTPTLALVRSQYFVNGNELDKGIAELRAFLDSGKDDKNVRMRLADLLAMQGRYDDAVAVLKPSVSDPAVAERHLALLLAAGRNDDARAAVGAILASSRNVDSLLLAADVEKRAGDQNKAMELVQEALKLEANNPRARYLRAQLRLAQQNPQIPLAIDDLMVVRTQAPTLVDARLQLATLYGALGRSEDRGRELEATVRDNPGDKRSLTALVDYYVNLTPPRYDSARRAIDAALAVPGLSEDAEVATLEARVATLEGRFEQAIAAARRAMDLSGGVDAYRRNYVQTLLLARAYDRVLSETASLATDDENRFWVPLFRAMALARSNQKPAARAEFDKALAMVGGATIPTAIREVLDAVADSFDIDTALADAAKFGKGDSKWLPQTALLYRRKGDFASAIRSLEAYVADPAVPTEQKLDPYQALGAYYLSVEPARPADAVRAFRFVTENSPGNIDALNNLAYTLTLPGSGGNTAEALTVSQKAYDLMQQTGRINPYVLDTHGWLLVLNGRAEDGVAVLRDALSRGELPEIHYHLGEAYLRLKQNDLARDHLGRCLALIKSARQSNRTVDPTLEQRVADAQARLAAAG